MLKVTKGHRLFEMVRKELRWFEKSLKDLKLIERMIPKQLRMIQTVPAVNADRSKDAVRLNDIVHPENVLNPEGLHVYSIYNSSRNTTPAGVALPMVVVHCYKHLMPLASAKNGPYDTFKNVPVTGITLLGNFNVWREKKYLSACATPENVLNPEGLHVYSFYISSRNTTPAGVALPMVGVHCYKHLMPLASAKNGPYDTFKNVPVTGIILLGNFNVWRKRNTCQCVQHLKMS